MNIGFLWISSIIGIQSPKTEHWELPLSMRRTFSDVALRPRLSGWSLSWTSETSQPWQLIFPGKLDNLDTNKVWIRGLQVVLQNGG